MPEDQENGGFDVLIVGAGFAGLYALHRLRDQMGLSVRVIERAADVGGVWYWNRYPGARCDIDSYHYCYSFSDELEQSWSWSERFARQPEILRYLEHVADRFALRPDIQFNTAVVGADWDETAREWRVRTDRGERLSARYLVSAVGCLSEANIPDFEGLNEYAGRTWFTGRWPHDGVDFRGQRVGVIGTGATGLQIIPHLARQAAQLYVFQRTPTYAAPLGNYPLDEQANSALKADYPGMRQREWSSFAGVPFDNWQPSALAVPEAEREARYQQAWQKGGFELWLGSYMDILFDETANRTAADFVRRQIRARVNDPDVAETLCPQDYPYGTKRQPLEDGYFETYNRDNVTLVDLRRSPLRRFVASGIRTDDRLYVLDAVVFATGFDAFTGSLFRMDIRGRDGLRLEDAWAEGPRTLLGMATRGFPNLFIVTGPQSPSVLFNMPRSIEHDVDWIADCIGWMGRQGLDRIEPREQAQTEWVRHTDEVAHQTLMPTADSWYLGSNIPGKPRVCLVYLGGGPAFHQHCRDQAAGGYAGFETSARRTTPA
ncbi:MAG: cyclohexanone monooxygenase [Salinisphaeraceae bacterium]|jgi:cyclohexanone monooxygenase|nr:cyclohexanone monooxygenase [Salinisphaeraceae bacterium]